MKKTIVIFVATFLTVFLLGLQGLNIVHYQYGFAGMTSLGISLTSYYLYKLMPSIDLCSWPFLASVIGALLGVWSSMLLFQTFFP